jgi:hypothetical protein
VVGSDDNERALLGGSWTHGVKMGAVEDSSKFTWVGRATRTMGIYRCSRVETREAGATPRRGASPREPDVRAGVCRRRQPDRTRIWKVEPDFRLPTRGWESSPRAINELRGYPMTLSRQAVSRAWPVGLRARPFHHSADGHVDAVKRALSATMTDPIVTQMVSRRGS